MAKPFNVAAVAFDALGRLLFSPVVAGSTLALLQYPPEQIRLLLAEYLSNSQMGILKKTAAALFAVGVVRLLNRSLNKRAANNWRARAQDGWEWDKEVAVVTGGCGGIGMQIAKGLTQRGIRVAIFDVQALPAELKGDNRISYHKCDLASSQSVAEAADAVRQTFGHPSVLVNNAGLVSNGSILRQDLAQLEKVFQVNTLSHWTTAQEFVPHMVEQNKGHIVTVASLASFMALPTGTAYSCTKASALAFHEALTQALKHLYRAPAVCTSIIHPHFTRTAMTASFADRLEKSSGPLLTAEYVANLVVAQILERRGAQIFAPPNSWVISGIRGWPTWLQELARDSIGKTSVER